MVRRGCKPDIRDPGFLRLTSTCCSSPPHPYPVVSQLQTDLYEGVGADAKLLDASFPEFGEGEHVAVHVGGHRLGHRQRAAHLSLHLRGGRAQLPQGDRHKGNVPHALRAPNGAEVKPSVDPLFLFIVYFLLAQRTEKKKKQTQRENACLVKELKCILGRVH